VGVAIVGAVTGDSEQVIETTGLTKHYGQVHALTELDIEVGRGVTGLVGANGAGGLSATCPSTTACRRM
jgi:ABC-2 type transport system ATP-binding protein